MFAVCLAHISPDQVQQSLMLDVREEQALPDPIP